MSEMLALGALLAASVEANRRAHVAAGARESEPRRPLSLGASRNADIVCSPLWSLGRGRCCMKSSLEEVPLRVTEWHFSRGFRLSSLSSSRRTHVTSHQAARHGNFEGLSLDSLTRTSLFWASPELTSCTVIFYSTCDILILHTVVRIAVDEAGAYDSSEMLNARKHNVRSKIRS